MTEVETISPAETIKQAWTEIQALHRQAASTQPGRPDFWTEFARIESRQAELWSAISLAANAMDYPIWVELAATHAASLLSRDARESARMAQKREESPYRK